MTAIPHRREATWRTLHSLISARVPHAGAKTSVSCSVRRVSNDLASFNLAHIVLSIP